MLVLAAKTDSAAGAKGITLFLVDTSLPGFRRGKNLHKLGMKAQDTSELFFDGLRVPASAMLGQEGRGFELMMTKLAQERLAQAIRSAAVAERVIDYTAQYTSECKAFGKTIGDFQNTQFKLAELATDAAVGRQFTDKCIQLFMQGWLDAVDAAMAKMYLSNLHCRMVDEYPRARGRSWPRSPANVGATSSERVPAGRFGQVGALQNLRLFLQADGCDYLTGQNIAIDGGYHLAVPGTFAELDRLTPEDWAEVRAQVRSRAQAEKARHRVGKEHNDEDTPPVGHCHAPDGTRTGCYGSGTARPGISLASHHAVGARSARRLHRRHLPRAGAGALAAPGQSGGGGEPSRRRWSAGHGLNGRR